MKSIKRERGVLKFVHPGRHIEIHREPIIASEVLRRNPRHSITRPDVFEFPWIVVKPESILVPGSVFLIVPNHTIYNLLKVKGQGNYDSHFHQQHGARPNWFGVNHVTPNMTQVSGRWVQPICSMGQDLISNEADYVKPTMTQVSARWDQPTCSMSQDPISSQADYANPNMTQVSARWAQPTCSMGKDPISVTADYMNTPTMTHVSTSWIQPTSSMDLDSISVEADYVNSNKTHASTRFSKLNKQYSPNNRVECSKLKYDDWEENDEVCTKLNGYEDTLEKSMECESLDESNLEFTPYQAVHYYQNHYKGGIDLEKGKKDVNLKFVANKQVDKLKSCLRRPNSIRKSLNLKVSFNISMKK
jgi:DNA-directed RNA polymerase subunit L